jgi:hypothetical protein
MILCRRELMDLSDGWAVDKRGPDCGKPIVN